MALLLEKACWTPQARMDIVLHRIRRQRLDEEGGGPTRRMETKHTPTCEYIDIGIKLKLKVEVEVEVEVFKIGFRG